MQFPYTEVEFTTGGSIHDPAQRQAAIDLVSAPGVTDVLVLAHGWNNDMPAARRLYTSLTDRIAEVRGAVPEAAARNLVVVGVLWPSVRWADEDDIAGGGVALETPAAALAGQVAAAVDDTGAADRLRELVPDLESSSAARAEYLRVLRKLLPPAIEGDEDPPPKTLVAGDADEAFGAAGGPETDLFDAADDTGGGAMLVAGPVVGGADGGSDGGGVGLLDVGRDFLRAARNLLNLTTYYTMKERAGNVGTVGVAGLLDAFAAAAPGVRRHLAGHSFGARVVAAASARHRPIHSVTLLQGAFSHNGFARDYDGQRHDGLFRPAVSAAGMTGPLVVTHTVNDKAVGIAYAVASRLADQAASELGGPDDRYGGIGRNGALRTPEVFAPAMDLLEVGGGYPFAAGTVYNLRADRFIASHGDVTGPQVAYALLRAIVS
jgi:hypothetical protein